MPDAAQVRTLWSEVLAYHVGSISAAFFLRNGPCQAALQPHRAAESAARRTAYAAYGTASTITA